MEYPKRIALHKLETLVDAQVPQEHKYKSGTVLSIGYLFEHTQPIIGQEFYVFQSKTQCTFRTSEIVEILQQNEEFIIFKTLNSLYKLEIGITDYFE